MDPWAMTRDDYSHKRLNRSGHAYWRYHVERDSMDTISQLLSNLTILMRLEALQLELAEEQKSWYMLPVMVELGQHLRVSRGRDRPCAHIAKLQVEWLHVVHSIIKSLLYVECNMYIELLFLYFPNHMLRDSLMYCLEWIPTSSWSRLQ